MDINYSTSMFIGQTSKGVAQPVFYDTHTPVFNDRPGGVLVTGKPGSGKTFFALTVTALSALLGKTTIVIDPKGDFLSLYNIQDQIGKVSIWNLGASGARSQAGILDPFYMAKKSGEKLTLVLSVIELFVGGLDGAQRTALAPIINDVIAMPAPSLQKVVDELRGSQRSEARHLGTELSIVQQQPIAKLCFAPGNRAMATQAIDRGVTIATMAGLKLPANAQEARSSSDGRLVSGLLFLLTDFIRRVLNDDESLSPKLVVIDEAWSVISSEAGANVIQSLALLGRSKNVALMLATQNSSHLKNLDIENTITTRFAFGTAQAEAAAIVKDMDLPQNEGFEGVLTNLERGECLFQDFRGRTAAVTISDWRRDWAREFTTNPLEKAKRRLEKEKAKR